MRILKKSDAAGRNGTKEKLMFITKVSMQRPVAVMMVIFTFIIFGIISFVNLPVDLVPGSKTPFVTVQFAYPGADPELIELLVVKPIEEQLTAVNSIKNISSYISEGNAVVTLEFNTGTDPDFAVMNIKNTIDEIFNRLPNGLQKPVISKMDDTGEPVLNIVLSGSQNAEELRKTAEKHIKEQILNVDGVAGVTIIGGKKREIHIDIHKHRLEALNISFQTIVTAVSSQTDRVSAGYISTNRKEYAVRIDSEIENLDHIRSIGIPVRLNNKTTTVPLYTIADVKNSYKEIREVARYNGSNCIGISICKKSDAAVIELGHEISNLIAKINKNLPDGTTVTVIHDQSKLISDTVNCMYYNILIGLVLIAFLLFLFIGNVRVALSAFLVITASGAVSFSVMHIAGLTLNTITLMAIALSTGTIATNTIIVLENIFRHRTNGSSLKNSVISGTREVAFSIFASVLITVVIFLPVATLQKSTGQFFKSFGTTVIVGAISSLFLSFTVTPLAALLFIKKDKRIVPGTILEKVFTILRELYLKIIPVCLQFRLLVITLTIILISIAAYFLIPEIGMEFFPKIDEGILTVSIELPPGTSIKETIRTISLVEQRLGELPYIESLYSSSGGGVVNMVDFAEIIIRLTDKKKRNRSDRDIANTIRSICADIPDAKIFINERHSLIGNKNERDIVIEISGDTESELLKISDSILGCARTISGLTDFQLSWKAARSELFFSPNRQMIDKYNISVAALGQIVRDGLGGREIAVYREKNDEYTVRMNYADRDRTTFDALENIPVNTENGIVPVKVLGSVKQGKGVNHITRKNRHRMIFLETNVVSGAAGSKAMELKKLTDKLQLPPGYMIHYTGAQAKINESYRSFILSIMLSIILIYVIAAGKSESVFKPFISMFSILYGMVGVLWVLYCSDQTISMMSGISAMMLIGVIVNNTLLITDYASNLEKSGKCKMDSIIEACRAKFNVIIMINLTVVLAMLPHAFRGSGIDKPFAITVIGGLIVSTIMTLLVIPALYMVRKGGKIECLEGDRDF